MNNLVNKIKRHYFVTNSMTLQHKASKLLLKGLNCINYIQWKRIIQISPQGINEEKMYSLSKGTNCYLLKIKVELVSWDLKTQQGSNFKCRPSVRWDPALLCDPSQLVLARPPAGQVQEVVHHQLGKVKVTAADDLPAEVEPEDAGRWHLEVVAHLGLARGKICCTQSLNLWSCSAFFHSNIFSPCHGREKALYWDPVFEFGQRWWG